MGLLSLSTLILTLSLCAIPTTTDTTTLPRSLAVPSGGFDVPKQKCPPDRGSSECVTGIPASSSPTASPDYNYFVNSNVHHPYSKSSPLNYPVSAAVPRAIPIRGASDLCTPPLSPDCGSESSIESLSPPPRQLPSDALDFLVTLFPRHGISALSYAKNVSISSENTGGMFEGVVLELPGKPRTLYVDGKSAQSVSLRESIVALLDLADERLNCSALVIVLERSSPALGDLLHSLMYVGGTVVTKPPFQVNPAFVLVGLEI